MNDSDNDDDEDERNDRWTSKYKQGSEQDQSQRILAGNNADPRICLVGSASQSIIIYCGHMQVYTLISMQAPAIATLCPQLIALLNAHYRVASCDE